MKVLFVRHGETDWSLVESRGIRGWAASFAPLTHMGRVQIDTIADDFRLQEAEAILCSSYARALESGARLSRTLNKPLFVEYDLHEWLPQKNPLGDIDADLLERANRTLRREILDGLPAVEAGPWETLEEVRSRVTGVLQRYRRFQTVLVVTHAVVISGFVGIRRQVDHAEIVPCDIDLVAPAVNESGVTPAEGEPVLKRR